MSQAADIGARIGRAAALRLAELDVCEIGPGLTEAEFARAEQRYGFEFSVEHMAFLATGLPLNSEPLVSDASVTHASAKPWPDWRSGDPVEVSKQLSWPIDGALFDVEHNALWHRTWGDRPADLAQALATARQHLAMAPTMIPVYGHRYLPSGRATTGHPVLSIYQTDIIVYGTDLNDYIEHEFGARDLAIPPGWEPPVLVSFWGEFL